MLDKKLLTLLKEIEKTQKQYWNIDEKTGQFMNIFVREKGYKKVLEIGTSSGYSALWLAEALVHNNGHLYTIESHKKHRFSVGENNIKKSGFKNITQILGHAPEAIPTTPKALDMAFFDATKEEYVEYFEVLKNRIKKGGVIIADNILSHSEAIKPYLKAVKKEPGWTSELINIGTGLLISYKK